MKSKEIISAVCDYYHVDPIYISTNRRHGEIIKVKHLSIYFVKEYTKQSLTSVGRHFVGQNPVMDHASVLHAINQVENQVDTDPGYRRQFNEIDEIIRYKTRYADFTDEDIFDYQSNDCFTELEINN